jgi:hypothetical protein
MCIRQARRKPMRQSPDVDAMLMTCHHCHRADTIMDTIADALVRIPHVQLQVANGKQKQGTKTGKDDRKPKTKTSQAKSHKGSVKGPVLHPPQADKGGTSPAEVYAGAGGDAGVNVGNTEAKVGSADDEGDAEDSLGSGPIVRHKHDSLPGLWHTHTQFGKLSMLPLLCGSGMLPSVVIPLPNISKGADTSDVMKKCDQLKVTLTMSSGGMGTLTPISHYAMNELVTLTHIFNAAKELKKLDEGKRGRKGKQPSLE